MHTILTGKLRGNTINTPRNHETTNPKGSKNYPRLQQKASSSSHLSHLWLPLDTGHISGRLRMSFLIVLGFLLWTLSKAFWPLVPALGAPRAENWVVLGGLFSERFCDRFLALFWVGAGTQKHGFHVGGVIKITFSAKLDFSPFWHPFWTRFSTQHGPQIPSWLILEALCGHLGVLGRSATEK